MKYSLLAVALLWVAANARAEELRLGPFVVQQWLSTEGMKQEKIGANCPAPVTTSRSLAEWTVGRWNAANELFVLVLQSRPRPCAVPAYVEKTRGLLEGGLGGTLALVRLGLEPVSVETIAALGSKFSGAHAWPRPPSNAARTELEMATPSESELPLLRLGLFCWPSKNGWPRLNKLKKTKPPFDASGELEAANACELWMVPVGLDGVPKVDGRSYWVRPVELAAAWGKEGAANEVVLVLEKSADAGVAEVAPVVVPSDAGVSCTPGCLPTCTQDQLSSPAMEDVKTRVEQHFSAQGLEVEWPRGGVPVLKGQPTPRDCAVFELLISTLSRHLSCQAPVARCAGAGG